MKLSEMIEKLRPISEESLAALDVAVARYPEVIVIGNGGSNAIAAHIAQDLTKCNGKRAHAFTDPSRLTCYMNDYGIERAYEMYVRQFADRDTLVILISSSGNSTNIVNAAQYCSQARIPFVMLTGFSKSNTMRTLFAKDALVDFWIDSTDYGVVECAHQAILHCVIQQPQPNAKPPTRIIEVEVDTPRAVTVGHEMSEPAPVGQVRTESTEV